MDIYSAPYSKNIRRYLALTCLCYTALSAPAHAMPYLPAEPKSDTFIMNYLPAEPKPDTFMFNYVPVQNHGAPYARQPREGVEGNRATLRARPMPAPRYAQRRQSNTSPYRTASIAASAQTHTPPPLTPATYTVPADAMPHAPIGTMHHAAQELPPYITPFADDVVPDDAPVYHAHASDAHTPEQANIVYAQSPMQTKDAPKDAPNVRLYDATQHGSAPTFSADSQTHDEVTPTDISEESQKVLSALPQDIFPDQRHPQGFNITRSDTGADVPMDETLNKSEHIDANIVTKRQPPDVSYELEKAYNALIRGNTDIAIAIYRRVLLDAPNHEDALFGLATTYHKLGMTERAHPLYGRLLGINPYHTEALNNFLALVGEQSPAAAITYLEQLRENNPNFSPIPAQLASLHHQQGNMGAAIAHMQEAVALSPENLIYMYNLAVLHDRARNNADAMRLYRQLIRAGLEGHDIPASLQDIQERLTVLASN